MENKLPDSCKLYLRQRLSIPLLPGYTLSETEAEEAKEIIDQCVVALKDDIDRCVHRQ
jgi:hypothetical protein